MVTSVESKIEGALLNRVTSMGWDANQIAWPNMDFSPTVGTKWIRPFVLPAETRSPGASPTSTEEHFGIFQISLFYPQGRGAIAPLEDVDTIVEHFKKDTKMVRSDVTVHVRKAPWRERAEQEPDWDHIPVRIPYRALVVPS